MARGQRQGRSGRGNFAVTLVAVCGLTTGAARIAGGEFHVAPPPGVGTTGSGPSSGQWADATEATAAASIRPDVQVAPADEGSETPPGDEQNADVAAEPDAEDAANEDRATDALAVLQSVDWANRAYRVPCPGPESTEVQLFDGKYLPELRGFYRGLGGVHYGEIGDASGGMRRMAAAVVITCIGAGHFPSSVLLYGTNSDGAPVELGLVAGDLMRVTNTDPPYGWEAETATFADGLLYVTGRGYTSRAAHCCPDVEVVAAYALTPDVPLEIAHDEIFDDTAGRLPPS